MDHTEPVSHGQSAHFPTSQSRSQYNQLTGCLTSWSCGSTKICFPSASSRFLRSGNPRTAVDNGRRIALVTRSSAVFCIVSFVCSCKVAACCRPRVVNGASGTESKYQRIYVMIHDTSDALLLQSLITLNKIHNERGTCQSKGTNLCSACACRVKKILFKVALTVIVERYLE